MKFYQDFQSFLNEARLSKKEIIGEPFEIGNIEIAEHDFYLAMDLEKANQSCLELGPGWRLPTGEELEMIFKENPSLLQDMHFKKDQYYWCSSEKAGRLGTLYQRIRTSHLKSGKVETISYFTKDGEDSSYVRAVRG